MQRLHALWGEFEARDFVDGQRRVVQDGRQHAALADLVGVLAQRLAQLFVFDLLKVCQQVLHAAELLQEFDGGFFADAGHAGDIV
jgi:hypothetical protein